MNIETYRLLAVAGGVILALWLVWRLWGRLMFQAIPCESVRAEENEEGEIVCGSLTVEIADEV